MVSVGTFHLPPLRPEGEDVGFPEIGKDGPMSGLGREPMGGTGFAEFAKPSDLMITFRTMGPLGGVFLWFILPFLSLVFCRRPERSAIHSAAFWSVRTCNPVARKLRTLHCGIERTDIRIRVLHRLRAPASRASSFPELRPRTSPRPTGFVPSVPKTISASANTSRHGLKLAPQETSTNRPQSEMQAPSSGELTIRPRPPQRTKRRSICRETAHRMPRSHTAFALRHSTVESDPDPF